ncbi:hypothetical protein Lesp02_16990 [Lentzea sp. NBRC 105346]|nr:hypothetical protein Lesp02_16990 [Lentzea sp. NBRC 105346]
MPSVVFASQDGAFVVGEDAERRALADPGRVARLFKGRIGDPTPLRIGDAALTAESVAARFAVQLLNSIADRCGETASRVAMTHPAGWGHYRLESLRTALSTYGLADALFVPEPLAAARAHDARNPTPIGSVVAVYDLGGATFEASVVRKLSADRFVLAGPPEEIEVGGLDFDEAVFQHVVEALRPSWDALDVTDPAVLTAVAELRRSCTAAKEMLSADTEVLIPVVLPGIATKEVRLGRAEFESMVRPAVEETVAALDRAIRAAGTDDLAAVLLIGGSSRIPLVTQEVSAQLGRAVSPAPTGIVAIGAALEARGLEPEPAAAAVTTMWTRPPLPQAPASLRAKRSWRSLTPLVTAGVLTAAVVGGLIVNDVFKPAGADAKPTTSTPAPTSSVVETTSEQPVETVQYEPPPPATATPPRMNTTQPPRPTTTSPKPTTTRPTTTTTTTTTTPPKPTTTTSGTTKVAAP